MKKLFYIFLLALASSITISSCTEVEIKPSTDNSGGAANEPIKR